MNDGSELWRTGVATLDAQPFSGLLEPGRAVLRVPIEPEHLQQSGYVHGGLLSYAADNL
jgi:acyl-coenzyme A thioesterase PaaI-like protein